MGPARFVGPTHTLSRSDSLHSPASAGLLRISARELSPMDDRHLAQCGDAVFQWRKCAKPGRKPTTDKKGFHNAKGRSGWRDNRCGDTIVVRAELFHRPDQARMNPHHSRALRVRGTFPL